tara:strand:+ start:72 stop:893 length:822 start_codon:yes stop_codon:yes gene_type:complete
MINGDITKLVELLKNEQAEKTDDDIGLARSRVYGGQLLGQGLLALLNSEEQKASSIKSLFMRPGIVGKPISYQISRVSPNINIFDVNAIQEEKHLFVMKAHLGTYSPAPSEIFPLVPSPDQCISRADGINGLENNIDSTWAVIDSPFEYRFTENIWHPDYKKPSHYVWFRVPQLPSEIRKSQLYQQAILAYFSDDNIMDNALFPHGWLNSWEKYQTATLDHSMWFHADIDLENWALFAQDSPVTKNGRGLTRGLFFNPSGQIVASAYQEILLR